MWFFYKETRLDRILANLSNLFQNILSLLYFLYYFIVTVVSIIYIFILPFEITAMRVIIFFSTLLISFIIKFILDIFVEPYFKKRKYTRKAQRRNSVVASKYFPHTDKKVAPVGQGKDLTNILVTKIKADIFRTRDVEDINKYLEFLKKYFDMNLLNNTLMNHKIGQTFFSFTKVRISYLIYYYLGQTFKVHPKQMYYDYQMKKQNMFYNSELIIKNGMYGKHIFDYLIDYIMIFIRLYYKNIYAFSNQAMYEKVCHKTKSITPTLPFGYNSTKMRSPDRIEVFAPTRNAIAESESGLNNHNLKRDLLTEMTKNGSIDFDPMKRQAFGEISYGKTDQQLARNVKVSEEHEQAKTYIQIVHELLLYSKRLTFIKSNLAFKKWFNFWIVDIFDISKELLKIERLENEKFLDYTLVMSETGLKKANKRFRFNEPEDMETGGYVKLMAYAIDIYSAYNTRYMGDLLRQAREESYDNFSKNHSKKLMKFEVEQNYYSVKPYESLVLSDDLIDVMGYSFMKDLKEAQRAKIEKERS